jgi:hypothetical protein
MDERELLNLVAEERLACIGFNNDQELADDRERALEYARGEMNDVPALANRSKVTSTDINDAVETVLPDLIEMFMGGDDIATFQPKGEEDEEAARQETEFVNHIIMERNDGFKNLYAAFKDALLIKTGVFKWWWEDYEEREEETFEGITPIQVQMLQADGWTILDVQETPDMLGGEPTLTVKAEKVDDQGCFEWCAWPGEDFAVARDTVDLKRATYVAARSRPRAQDLIADGYDADKVASLTTYSAIGDDSVQNARNTVDEDSEGSNSPLRQVEIVEHFVRIKEAGSETIYRVVTGNNEGVLLEKEEVEEIPFASICPYPVAHRFYGRSLADLLVDVQRIKTAVLRMFLDSGYFALNQRYAVDMNSAHDFTISDLLRNEPGVPVRVKGPGAVTAIQSGGLNFPALEAMEYASTMGEVRTGVVRNAQGLNSDALHDTAKGMQVLVSAAQKRVRMIGRIFAETGVRDLFLGAHAMLRRHGGKASTARLRGGWVDVDPSSWGIREDMSIEVGIGSGGKEQEMVALNQGAAMMDKLISMQGGTDGPFVSAENLHSFLKKYFERGLGFKSADAFISDPAKAPPKQEQQPPPDPKIVEMQQKMQLEQQKLQADIEMQRAQLEAETQLKREQMAAEMQLKREQMMMASSMSTNLSAGDIRFGGEVG